MCRAHSVEFMMTIPRRGAPAELCAPGRAHAATSVFSGLVCFGQVESAQVRALPLAR